MNSILITAPTDSVMSLSDCKAMLGITTSDDDAIIDAALSAAISSVDAASGGWLDRALRPQTWELRLCQFPYCDDWSIRLPFPPLVSVTSIKYDDAGGDEQTLVENTDYIVLGIGSKTFGKVRPAYNKIWPSSRSIDDSVRLRYVCGYAVQTDDSPPIPDQMPIAIKQGIAMMVRSIVSSASQNLFIITDRVEGVGEKRYAVTQDGYAVMQQAAEALLSPYQAVII